MAKQMTAWTQEGNTVWGVCANRAFTPAERLPPGLYKYVPTMTGWLLDRVGDRFEFPFKVYGTEDELLSRVQRAWEALPQNIGVLLNGLKGTGKTVTAQLLANWAVDSGMVVLMVRDPIPLDVVLAALHQDVVVIFDEFEKTHRAVKGEANPQEALLTTLDGMSRGLHKRLFVLTTNSRVLDPNLVDRPSRIRYSKEYTRVSDDVVFEIIDDMLPPHLAHIRTDLATYVFTREVLSIDVVKTVIQECVAFEEPPSAFAHLLNLSARAPAFYKIYAVLEDGTDVCLLDNFIPDASKATTLATALTSSDRALAISKNRQSCAAIYCTSGRGYMSLGSPVEGTDDRWHATVGVPIEDTWLGPHATRFDYGKRTWVFYATKPDGWVEPSFKATKKGRIPAEFTDLVDCRRMYNVGADPQALTVRIVPVYPIKGSVMERLPGKDGGQV